MGDPKAVLSELLRRRAAGADASLSRDSAGVPDTLEACGIRLDISRQRVDRAALDLLRNLAVATDVTGAERAMARGDAVNVSERRPALHTALRSIDGATFGAPPEITNAVRSEQERARRFADDVRTGAWRGASGRPIDAVVNIGIGGSDSGPRLVCDALAHLADGPAVHFLSNVDGHAMARLLPRLDPQTTLAIVSSKSFTTRETLLNAATFVHWFRAAGIEDAGLTRHIVAVSARTDAALGLQLPDIQQFMLWDWVGGRFSVWSAIGLPAMLAIGPQRFTEFLGGAHALDRHALDAPLERNLPATLALLAFWNSVVLQMPSHCLLPYDDRLRTMVTWLQQLEMESLGKSRTADGALTEIPTSQVVWGGVGTDAQHTFFQALRQGTQRTAIDIVLVERPNHRYVEHHRVLLANARAQAEALVNPDPDSRALNAVSVLQLDELTPAVLGSLLALYEHKTTMLATLLGINAFDQPGVEFGKSLARDLEAR